MTAADPARKLSALLKRLRAAQAEGVTDPARAPAGGEPAVQQLLLSFLAWEAGLPRAALALRKLLASVVDLNELRVCHPDELAAMLGERYPKGLERCARMRSSLNDLYRREHAVTLAHLDALPKRDARMYLASLEGIPEYVVSRVLLLSLGGHAFPLDERTRAALTEAGAIPADLPLEDASGWLERQFRAGEAAEAHALLEAWVSEGGARPSKRRDGNDTAGRGASRTRGTKRAAKPPSSA